MPINISVTTRRDPLDRNSERKYHVAARSKGRIHAGGTAWVDHFCVECKPKAYP